MNCEVFHLRELEVEPHQIREVLRSILHTVAFHRALGLVRPKDVDLEIFEITYVQCRDPDLEKKIEEKIDQFVSWVEKHPNKKSQVFLICLSFYEIRNKQTAWFSNKPERFYWEQWYIPLNVVMSKASSSKSHHGKALAVGEVTMEDNNSRHAALEEALRDVLLQIIRHVNEKKDHIPPVQNFDAVPFPYEITIPRSLCGSSGVHSLGSSNRHVKHLEMHVGREGSAHTWKFPELLSIVKTTTP